jgi:hypothetical protein
MSLDVRRAFRRNEKVLASPGKHSGIAPDHVRRRRDARAVARPKSAYRACGTAADRSGSDSKCGACHPAPFYLDDKMHDLRVERFYTARTISGEWIHAEGPIKTFTLRGIKDSPPYLHDGRLLTLEDTVEVFHRLVIAWRSAPPSRRPRSPCRRWRRRPSRDGSRAMARRPGRDRGRRGRSTATALDPPDGRRA